MTNTFDFSTALPEFIAALDDAIERDTLLEDEPQLYELARTIAAGDDRREALIRLNTNVEKTRSASFDR